MSSLLMKTDDSDDENESFRTKMCIKIRKFLRLKDIHKVRDTMRYNDRLMCDEHVCKRKQQRSCKDYNNNQSDSEMSVVYAFDTEDESGDEIDKLIKKQNGEPFEWFTVWTEISTNLEKLKLIGEIYSSLEYFTYLIQLHIDHRIELDLLCYRCLLNCMKPELIVKIFDLNLLNTKDQFHIGCLYTNNDLFEGIDVNADNIETINKYASELLLSLSVLIYKDKSALKYGESIINSLNTDLAVFINREDRDTGRKANANNSLSQAVKQLLKACVLNGFFETKRSLDSFLSNREFEMEDLDSSTDDSLSEMLSSDDEPNPLVNFVQRHIRLNENNLAAADIIMRAERADGNRQQPYNPRSPPPAPPPLPPRLPARRQVPAQQNPVNNNNERAQPVRLKSVGDRINLSSSSNELNLLICPMSLKNLCRLKIKSEMNPYNLDSVNTLRILPNVLKKFVIFQDEVDEIVRLTNEK